jgi:hypothetical protein
VSTVCIWFDSEPKIEPVQLRRRGYNIRDKDTNQQHRIRTLFTADLSILAGRSQRLAFGRCFSALIAKKFAANCTCRTPPVSLGDADFELGKPLRWIADYQGHVIILSNPIQVARKISVAHGAAASAWLA